MVQSVHKHRIYAAFNIERHCEIMLLKENSRLLEVHFKGITEVIVITAIGYTRRSAFDPLLHSPRAGKA